VLNHGGLAWGTSGFQYSIGGPAKTLDPVNVGGGIVVCVNVNRAEGWCDCTGGGKSTGIALCQDRIATGQNPDDCGEPAVTQTDDTQGYGHTKVGGPHSTLSGASVSGDCLSLFTTQFTIFTGPCTGLAGDPCGP